MTETDKLTIKKLAGLFFVFFKIGLLTIGGGLVMVPVMHREFVEKRKWVDNDKMSDIFSVAQALPGVIAINTSVYIGYSLYGLPGAIMAVMGITLPSLLCILIIFFALSNISDNIYLHKFYTGVRAAVVALVTIAALKLGKSAVKDKFGVIIAFFGIIATLVLKIDMAYVILTCGISGYIYYYVIKNYKQNKAEKRNESNM